MKRKVDVRVIRSNKIKKIDKYLEKLGHNKVFSIYLDDYNKSNIYIRFDFIKKMSVYKVSWFDLDFLNEKKIEKYHNVQMVNKNLAISIVKNLNKVNYSEEVIYNDEIIGDRVFLTFLRKDKSYSYGFTRFLPDFWDKFIDPIVIVFSYLPRSMDIYLSEIFAIFDGNTEIFTYTKPIKFDLFKSNPLKYFSSLNIDAGTKFYASSRVLFLEKIENKYFAIVEDKEMHLVILNQIDDEHAMMWCNCKKGYLCRHIYAALLALRHESFNNFYKVKYSGGDVSLLDKVMSGNIYLCYGVNNNKILLLTLNGDLYNADIVQDGKCVFEVIEDDDECSLSNVLKEYSN